MQTPNIIHLQPVNNLFSAIPDTDLSALIKETFDISNTHPKILQMIEDDLDAYGIEKKKQRCKDRQWLKSHGTPLPGFDIDPDEDWLEDLSLNTGRPRMPAIAVLLFIVIRGYFGGFKNRKTAMLLAESKTIEICLMSLGIKMPGSSTIIANSNAITSKTLEKIIDAQIKQVRDENLDDFLNITFDSTDVKANSTWPTESALIVNLADRAINTIKKLGAFGVSLHIPKKILQSIVDIGQINKTIQLLKNKKDSKKKRAKLYRKLYRLARKILKELKIIHKRAESKTMSLKVMPSIKKTALQLVEWLDADLKNLDLTVDNSSKRINKGAKIAADEKFLSLSDEDAAMIVKGGREPRFGYKPQLGRSENGFITALIVPEGNAADSGQIETIADTSMARTRIVPDMMSFDDGYTNTTVRDRYKAIGIEVSFSGSKGKKIIPVEKYDSEQYKNARNNRSAVESLMFVLKHNNDFEQLMRRGIDAVRSELLEKVIVYNFFRIIKVRLIQQEQKQAA